MGGLAQSLSWKRGEVREEAEKIAKVASMRPALERRGAGMKSGLPFETGSLHQKGSLLMPMYRRGVHRQRDAIQSEAAIVVLGKTGVRW